MRVLLLPLLGCLVLGAVLVEAHRDRAESDIEAKNEGVQGDFVKEREIRSTGGKKKKNRPSLKSTPGVFSALSRPEKTKRSIADSPPDQKKRKKCPGCYTSLLVRQPQFLAAAPVIRKQRRQPQFLAAAPVIRKQRDSEVHEKIRKKNKHLKEKSKSKRRRNKEHKERERHAHIQTEDPEIGENNNKRRKHHHRGRKDKGHRHTGGFSSISSISPDMRKTQMDIRHTEDITN